MKTALVILLSALCSIAQAEGVKVDVIVPAAFEPQTVVGVLITKDGTSEYPVADLAQNVRRINDKQVVVTFVAEGPVYADTYASALVISADGRSAYGDVRRVSDKPGDNVAKALPACPVKSINDATLMSKASELQQLVSVRLEKRKLVRDLLKEALTDDAMTKIRGLESLFGFSYEQ